MTSSVSDSRLMAGFGFDEQDLAANRAGRITEWQMQLMRQERAEVNRKTLGCLGGFLAISVFYAVIGLMNDGRIPNPSSGFRANVDVVLFVFILAIVVVLVLAILIGGGKRASRDWSQRIAEMTEGSIELSAANANKDNCLAKINGKTFGISKPSYEALQALHTSEGANVIYRVYYAPGSWKILSIEKGTDERGQAWESSRA
jgi:hypothetical protein